jgi:hypothetical protein
MEHPMGVENPRTDISDLDADGRELTESELSATRGVVAQRMSTVQDADLILVMSDRQVAEQGTHLDLVDLGGTYTRVVAAQPGDRRGLSTPRGQRRPESWCGLDGRPDA